MTASKQQSKYLSNLGVPPLSKTGVTLPMRRDDRSRIIALNEPMYDWITLTSYESDLYDNFVNAIEGASEIRELKRMQYVGRLGYFTNGSLFVGSGLQGPSMHTLVQISGSLAHQFADAAKFAIRECNSRLTRVDIQVTIQEPDGWDNQGMVRLFNRLDRENLHPGWEESIDSEFGRMITVYRGSRTSDRFARCYMKASELSRPLLRLEFEISGKAANAYGLGWTSGRSDRHRAYLWLLDWYKDVELTQHFRHAVEGFNPMMPRAVRAETKTERWLMSQVLPSFVRHINEHGTDGRVLSAFADAITDVLGVKKVDR